MLLHPHEVVSFITVDLPFLFFTIFAFSSSLPTNHGLCFFFFTLFGLIDSGPGWSGSNFSKLLPKLTPRVGYYENQTYLTTRTNPDFLVWFGSIGRVHGSTRSVITPNLNSYLTDTFSRGCYYNCCKIGEWVILGMSIFTSEGILPGTPFGTLRQGFVFPTGTRNRGENPPKDNLGTRMGIILPAPLDPHLCNTLPLLWVCG